MKKEIFFTSMSGRKNICIVLMCILISFFTLSVYAENPIFRDVYTADPSAYIGADGRMYVVCTHDHPDAEDYNMLWDYYVFSSSDMVNWQNHGVVFDVRSDSSWAGLAYAPSMAYRNGTYYLYYPNGASSIGVATSSSPAGPFRDAIGRAMVDKNTPNSNVEWCFDPCIFVDDDGQAYLYFGGGGPGNARVIKVNSDMTSVSGSAVTIDAPRFFEAAFMHKRNGIYYFSYSSDFSEGSATIEYMTSNDPMTGFQHRGTVLGNPWDNLGNNNHHSIIEYQGQWYIFYHNRALSNSVYQRSVCVDYLYYNSNGTIQRVNDTREGVNPVTTTVEPTPDPTPTAGNPGDVNGDGSIDILDALLIAQYYVGLEPVNFISGNADTNCDGTIDILDALLVAQFYVGLLSVFC
jgi:arabinoxylan arabinofuranohydrolase